MSIFASICIDDYATPALEAKMAKLKKRTLAAKVGDSLEPFWRNRIKSLGRNKRGWPSTGFYEKAARSVTNVPQENGDILLVADHQGLRQRWKGGPIVPVRAMALAIPISPVSYGKHPKQFTGLFLLRTKKGAYLAQRGEQVSEKTGKMKLLERKGAGGNHLRRHRASLHLLFKLSKGVMQSGDERIVPTPEEFAEVAIARLMQNLR